MYEQSWWRFKEHVYGEIAEKKHIDRHKIAALYILSFLAKRPFVVRPSDARLGHLEKIDEDRSFLLDQNNRRLLLANELFCYVILRDILFSWDDKKDTPFDMEENKKAWFMILLNSYSFKLEPESNSQVMSDESLFLSLSQIIYYIEEKYRQEAEA
ncbi:MAG: hypothetical protein LBH25_07530 [Fibromonadaceae bacterium]|jgi:hypothetical protein|nr:hypothetical protein [Fibromonadaceae bacterium]